MNDLILYERHKIMKIVIETQLCNETSDIQLNFQFISKSFIWNFIGKIEMFCTL